MKYIFFLLFIIFSIKSFSQSYELQKPKELKYLDLKIQRPIEIPFYAEDYFLPKDLKIKTKTFYNKIEEYDIKGNMLREEENNKLYKSNITYTYNNNILIKKVKTVIGNKEKIKREQEKTEEEIRRNAKSNGVYTTVNLETEDKETINIVNLDKNNKIISFSFKNYNLKDGKKELKAEDSYQVIYKGNQISEIKGKFNSEKYYYNGKLLTKKVCHNEGTSQTITETYSYQYDERQNLVSISISQIYSMNKFTQEDKKRVLDSANYDSKNRIIWQGLDNRFTTFKYDKKNNITESIFTNRNKLDDKKEYQYNDENELIKITNTQFRSEKNGNVPVFSKTFVYKNHLLKEILRSNGDILQNKIIYDYNEDGHIIKISEYNIDKSKNEANQEFLNSETNYSWNGKTMTIESKYGQPIIYTFY